MPWVGWLSLFVAHVYFLLCLTQHFSVMVLQDNQFPHKSLGDGFNLLTISPDPSLVIVIEEKGDNIVQEL